jgi:hypothetical protein
MSDKWEYKVIKNPKPLIKVDEALEKELNNLAQEGWELVSFQALGAGVVNLLLILRRKV